MPPGRNMYPDRDSVGFLDMETGLFQTEKGAVIKILASQTVKRYRKNGSYLTWYSLYGTRGFVESGRDPTEEGLEDDLRVGLIVHRDHVGMIGSKGREGPGILDATTGTPTRTIHAGQ